MAEEKTIQRRIRPVTIRCGAPRCPTKDQDAVVEEVDEATGKRNITAPKGWTFNPLLPGSTRDLFVGLCPLHANKK